jgi:hypothetical protein
MIDVVVERAKDLHAAGVTSLSIEGFSITLCTPPAPVATAVKPDPVPVQHINPLKDASTYPGGRVPGFTREDEIP